MGMVLNQGHICTKYFTPTEIEQLTKEFHTEDHSVTMPAGEKFSLGQPAELPTPLLRSLSRYCRSESKLKEIYFGLLVPEQGEHRYIGVLELSESTTEQEKSRLFQDLMHILKETLKEDKFMDFCELKECGFQEAIQKGALKTILSY